MTAVMPQQHEVADSGSGWLEQDLGQHEFDDDAAGKQHGGKQAGLGERVVQAAQHERCEQYHQDPIGKYDCLLFHLLREDSVFCVT